MNLRHLNIVISLIFSLGQIFGQKPAINFEICNNWESIIQNSIEINNEGTFVKYVIQQGENKYVIVLQSVDGDWKRVVPRSRFAFSEIGNIAITLSNLDTLSIIKLGSNEIITIGGVKNFELVGIGEEQKIAYLLKNGSLVIQDLLGKGKRFFSVGEEYVLSHDGRFLVFKRFADKVDTGYTLSVVNVGKEKIRDVWKGEKGEKVTEIVLSTNEEDFLFRTSKLDGVNVVWYFDSGEDTATKLIDDNCLSLKQEIDNLYITGAKFCDSNRGVLLSIDEKIDDLKKDVVKLNVWGYYDARLPTNLAPTVRTGLINLKNRKFGWIAKHGQNVVELAGGSRWLVFNSIFDAEEIFWRDTSGIPTPYLIEGVNGNKRLLEGLSAKYLFGLNISPDGAYIVYYDSLRSCWVSYNTTDLKEYEISQRGKGDWKIDLNGKPYNAYGLAVGWILSEAKILIQDDYDIWSFDLTGKSYPISITGKYGAANKIRFQFSSDKYAGRILPTSKELIILHGFNMKTKESGFYVKNLNDLAPPLLLSKGRCLDLPVPGFDFGFRGYLPKKASAAEVYVLARSDSNSSVNIYTTTDFAFFKRMSNVAPETKCNWFTSELHVWKSYDGKDIQGILYKPENFNPKQLYPVVFCYYERRSNGLNTFIKPEPFDGDANMPWLVSNGYLVFVPDIEYVAGDPGISAYNCVASAADYVSRLPYVDTTKFALFGHSMGAYETNFIVTRAKRFASAVSACGMTEMASWYSSLWGVGSIGYSRQFIVQYGQCRMKYTPWESAESYVRNSPIYFADKINTPMLIVGNRRDGHVSFEQTLSLFLALRRLNKPCWMLEYDNGTHGLQNALANDFTLRAMQFLNFYLMRKSPPKWMLETVNPRYRMVKYDYYLK